MIDNPKISIVIPVYNTEQYLEECLRSVINQTLKEIEIICIDDGSTDRSPRILDDYARVDSRICVLHKNNTGYGHSVNIGIEKSRGAFIGIVEPDDYIKPGMYKTLYENAIKNNVDIITSNYQCFYDANEQRIFKHCSVFSNPSLYNVVGKPRHELRMFKGDFINPAGLFRKKFLEVNHIRHNQTPGASFQDRGFCFQTLAYAERILVLQDSFYYYRHDNPNSSISNKMNMDCIIEEYRLLYKLIKANEKKMGVLWPEFYRRKYASYRFAFTRCDSRGQLDFLYKISKEFNDSQLAGDLDISDFPNDWKEEIMLIMDEPQAFLNKFLKLKDEIHECVQSYDTVVIYGAGVIGRRIYDEMYENDKAKVKGFAVTNCAENMNNYREIPIIEIDAYNEIKEEIAVIVGVTARYRQEIVQVLQEKKFPHIILLETEGTNI